MPISELEDSLLLQLSKEEERLLRQRIFLQKIKVKGSLASINANASSVLEEDVLQYISDLGDTII